MHWCCKSFCLRLSVVLTLSVTTNVRSLQVDSSWFARYLSPHILLGVFYKYFIDQDFLFDNVNTKSAICHKICSPIGRIIVGNCFLARHFVLSVRHILWLRVPNPCAPIVSMSTLHLSCITEKWQASKNVTWKFITSMKESENKGWVNSHQTGRLLMSYVITHPDFWMLFRRQYQ